MEDRYCRCPGCGECDAHRRARASIPVAQVAKAQATIDALRAQVAERDQVIAEAREAIASAIVNGGLDASTEDTLLARIDSLKGTA